MRRLSAIPKLLGWLVLAGAALALSAWWHAGLPIARSAARDALNQVASQAMRGALVVGRFDELDDKHIVARHVALFDPDGRRVIVANRLELTPDGSLIAQLWRDSTHVRFRDARLSGGTVHLVDAGDGLPTLFQSFDSPTPSSTPSASSEAVHVDITKVELNDVTLYGDLLGLQNLRAEHMTAHGAMEIGSDVNVTVHDAHGNLTEPFGFVAGIDELAGTISTRPEVGVTLHARAHRDSEQASMQLELKSPTPTEPQVLDLRLDAQPISSDTLSRMHFTWAEPLAGMYRGQIRLHGPTSALQLDGSVTGDAGNVQVHGSIADADGVKVHLASDDIMLAKLVASAPNLSVKGAMDLTIPKPNTPPQLHLELAALRYKGIAVPAVQVEGVIESDHLRIVEARTTAKGARLRAKGNVGWNGSADLNVDAFFPAIERDPNLSRMADNVHGSLTASVRIRTPNDNRGFLDMNGRVVLAHFVYGSISADRVTLTGSAKGDPSLPTLRLTVLAENTSVLAYSLGTARFALNGGPRGYQAEGEFQAKAQRTFYFNAKILADRKGFTAQADPIEFAVGDNTWRGVARDIVVVHGDRVELGLLRLASRSQRLEAHSVIHVHGEDYASAQLQDFDLAAVHALLGKRFPFDQGRADATVEVHGDVTRPELVLQGAMRGGKALDIEGIDALYSINYKDGQLDLDSEIDVGDRGTLNLKGQAAIDPTLTDLRQVIETGRYDLSLEGQRFDLTLVPGLKDKVFSGRATGTLHATGTLDVPDLSGKLELKDLRLPETAPLGVTTNVEYHGRVLSGDLAVEDTAGPVGNVHGSLELDWAKQRSDPHAFADALMHGHWELTGATNERRLDHLPVPIPRDFALPLIVGTNFDLRRMGGPADGFVRFVAKPPQALAFEECKLQVVPELRGMLIVEGGTTKFSFTGHLDGKRVAFGTGGVDIDIDPILRGEQGHAPGHANLQGDADFDDVSRVPWLCRHGSGDLHAKWTATDLLTAHPNAELTLEGNYHPRTRIRAGRRLLSVDSCAKDPIHVALSAKADSSSVEAKGRASGCGGGTTDVQAFVPITWNDVARVPELDATRDTDVQLDFADAQLRPLLDRIPGVLSFSALANGKLAIRGSAQRVTYTGYVALHDGELYPIATGQQLTNISASLTGKEGWIKIDSLGAKAGDGTLSAQGGIGFERWSPKRIQLALLMRKFPIKREAVDLAWLTGSAALSTDIGEEKATTAVKLHSLAVSLPEASSRSLQPLEPHPDVSLTTEAREHPDIPYSLEFFVDGRVPITVKRNDFDATIRTELAMSYQDPDFRVGGYVEFQRGTFEVFGKEFVLNRGTMHFDGTGELNPEVNMVATHEPDGTGGSAVVVNVTGTLAEPHVEFQSDSCPGDGAVVMLVSGRCPNEDPNSGGSAQDAQDAFAAGVIGGILTLGAKRELGALIPRISVESRGQGAQTRLKAGFEAVPKFMRSFVQRVYLQGAVSTGDQGTSSTTDPAQNPNGDVASALDFLIELYFPHNIVGSGKFSPERFWGLDVTWEP